MQSAVKESFLKRKVGGGLLEHFSMIPDPRSERKRKHLLMDILTISIGAVICGAEGWVDIYDFGVENEQWLRSYLQLPHGIPSHDTFARVFSILDSETLEKVFIQWTAALQKVTQGQIVAIDGKTLRGSFDKVLGKRGIHLVSAWVVESQIVLGQLKVDEKSNEITAVPKLLDLLNIKGSVVTMDAMGCQTDHTEKIIAKQADYLLSLKGNQGDLHKEVNHYFESLSNEDRKNLSHDFFETTEKGHGRIEIRKYWQTNDIDWIVDKEKWKGLKTVGMVEATRILGDKESAEKRYFISSLSLNSEKFAGAVRGHWGIENSLHWSLDVGMGEDLSRIRMKNAAENFGVLRRVCLNLLKKEKSRKRGLKGKSKIASWNKNYLLQVLIA